MGTPDITDRLAAVLGAPVEALGLDLEAVDLSKAGKRSVLRVAVDKDGGVDMDDIAEATKAVSAVLDDSDLMGSGAFTLEVSSPGVDRPLTHPRHWRRNQTRLVKVDLVDGEAVTGRIVAADDSGATLDVEGTEQVVSYEAIAKAKIQIEFKREG
ncbi:MAG: rimP [Marmoricola sp.]|nr:rimP [Marmoricola sp.]